MLIREWKFEDILVLTALEEQCFENDRWSYRTFASCYENPAFYGVVAVDGEEIIGYGGITVAGDSADIENILVSERYRRSGVGTRILGSLSDYARTNGVKDIFLEVRVSNAPAMRLCLKRGYVGCGVRPRYYADGEDALIMQKRLAGANS